jgi:hypothetical protein
MARPADCFWIDRDLEKFDHPETGHGTGQTISHRMDEMPQVDVHLMPRAAKIGPAVANAVFAATGKRIRKPTFAKIVIVLPSRTVLSLIITEKDRLSYFC